MSTDPRPRRIPEVGWAMFAGDEKIYPADPGRWAPSRRVLLANYERAQAARTE